MFIISLNSLEWNFTVKSEIWVEKVEKETQFSIFKSETPFFRVRFTLKILESTVVISSAGDLAILPEIIKIIVL